MKCVMVRKGIVENKNSLDSIPPSLKRSIRIGSTRIILFAVMSRTKTDACTVYWSILEFIGVYIASLHKGHCVKVR